MQQKQHQQVRVRGTRARGVAHGPNPTPTAKAPSQGRGELRDRPPTTRIRRCRGCRCAHPCRPSGTTARSGGVSVCPQRRAAFGAVTAVPFRGAGNCATGHRPPASGVGEGAGVCAP
ncbi:hypothetical protein F6Q10_24120 [Streptomyces vinaceus]|nr:hypothetical protein [Streptomyces vinaceus]